jgi:putative transposase
MRVQRSGFYAWLKQPVSNRGREDLRLLGLIRSFYAESAGLYGSPRIHKDLKEFGEHCGENRVARLMRQDGIRAQRGYKRPRYKAGPAAVIAPNRVQQTFSVPQQAA